ncbi:MAG: alpha/beta hydrolase [Alphaproteobacteria bacterium]
MTISYFQTKRNYKIAYKKSEGRHEQSALPTVVFLGGFKSDMTGTKAVYLEEECKKRGQGFVRFDYFGHGESEGDFVDGTIGRWLEDAADILDNIVQGKIILVGSSMGGWISLLLLMRQTQRIHAFVGIAAAPDFTKEIEAELSDAQKQEMMETGLVKVPNDYSDDPYIFTRALIEDGRNRCVLDKTHQVDVPMVLLQGRCDTSVPWKKALRIKEHVQSPEAEIIFIDDGDHRLSRPQDLTLLGEVVERLTYK